jgi:hypothetical protein
MRVSSAIVVSALAAASFLLVVSSRSPAEIEGLEMVGIGTDPDTLEPDPNMGPPTACVWIQAPEDSWFRRADIRRPIARKDIDLLISLGLNGTSAVTQGEVGRLIDAFDHEHANRFDVEEKDLELLVNYFSNTSSYDTTGTFGDWNYDLFPTCE